MFQDTWRALKALRSRFRTQRERMARLEGFSANVAHELRTPLATLITGTELSLREGGLPPPAQERLGANLEELRRLSGIVDDMLFLAQARGGQRARREPVDSLALLAREVASFHEAAIDEAGLTLRVDGDGGGDFDAPLLRRALSNLIDNAARYATPGSAIRVGIEALGRGRMRLSVLNEGAEIPPDRLPRLFDRFYRADAPRERPGEHHGLGLSIVAAIARMHGGAPFARSGPGGTRIGLTLSGARRPSAYTARRSPTAAPP